MANPWPIHTANQVVSDWPKLRKRSCPGGSHANEGDRRGQHSIRINRQWRVCLHWTPDGPEAVEIADYD